MYEEMQVLSPLVPTRQFYFLRFCQQIEQGSWAIVDVSYDIPQDNYQSPSSCKVHRLPSGCLIQDMPNGYSNVTNNNSHKLIEVLLLSLLILREWVLNLNNNIICFARIGYMGGACGGGRQGYTT